MNTEHIAPNSLPDNLEIHSAPDTVLERERVRFAAGLAQAAFGAAYAPPDHANFCDHSPAAIAAMRAAMWGSAK